MNENIFLTFIFIQLSTLLNSVWYKYIIKLQKYLNITIDRDSCALRLILIVKLHYKIRRKNGMSLDSG